MNYKKIVLIFTIFFSLFSRAFWMDVSVSTDKNQIQQWEVFNLKIEIEWNLSSGFQVWEIKWLENFEVLGKSQSQSSATKTVIVNWQTQTESQTIYSIFYTLKWIDKWDFTLWPISISNSENSIITNPINIKVSSDGIFSNIVPENEIKVSWNNFYESKISNSKVRKGEWLEVLINVFLFFIWVVLLFLLFLYFKNKEKIDLLIKNLMNKSGDKNETLLDNRVDENIDNINKTYVSAEIKDKSEVESKLEEEKENIDIYPDLEDEDFISKLEDIFLCKLKEKFNIEWIENKTYVDILWELEGVSYYEKEKIKMLGNLFNKAKYSNIWVEKEELLGIIKGF